MTRDAQERGKSPLGLPLSSLFLFLTFSACQMARPLVVCAAPGQELSFDGASSYVKKVAAPFDKSAAHLSELIKNKNDGSHPDVPWDN